MATLTASEVFDAVAPELADSASKDTFLTMAEDQLAGVAVWGTAVHPQAVAYLAAHLLTLAADDGSTGDNAGPVTGRSAGGTSISYGTLATKTTEEAELATTKYGRRFLALRKTRAATSARVISPGY